MLRIGAGAGGGRLWLLDSVDCCDGEANEIDDISTDEVAWDEVARDEVATEKFDVEVGNETVEDGAEIAGTEVIGVQVGTEVGTGVNTEDLEVGTEGDGADGVGTEDFEARQFGAGVGTEFGAEQVLVKGIGAERVWADEIGDKWVGAEDVGAKGVGTEEIGADEVGIEVHEVEGSVFWVAAEGFFGIESVKTAFCVVIEAIAAEELEVGTEISFSEERLLDVEAVGPEGTEGAGVEVGIFSVEVFW